VSQQQLEDDGCSQAPLLSSTSILKALVDDLLAIDAAAD